MKKPKSIESKFAEIRGILRGWAFAPVDWIPKKIQRAEEIRDSLPDFYWQEADSLIQPLREA
jgi:hypothetical protein